jgi:RNA polymerase sigma-70 factor, ECF subfamily
LHSAVKDKQFESLVKSFYQQLYRYAYWTCRSQATAEDLVQETFARAWKNLDQLKDINAAKSWLYTILSRENARQFQRKPLPMAELTEEWQLEQIADPKDDFSTMAMRRAIFNLDDTYREAMVLQIIGGLSTNEIASALKTNANTISTRLFRGRAELKKQLSANKQSTQISKVNHIKGDNNG